MTRAAAITLMTLGILLGVVGLVAGYNVGVIADLTSGDTIPRGTITLLLGCAVASMAAGGVVAIIGFIGFHSSARPQQPAPAQTSP
jgi:hypothetical protein